MQEVRGVVKQLIKANEIQLSDTNFSVLDILRDQVTEMELIKRHIYKINSQLQEYNRGELGLWSAETLADKRALLFKLEERYRKEFTYLQTLLDEVDTITGPDHGVLIYYITNPDLTLEEIGRDLGYTGSAVHKSLERYTYAFGGKHERNLGKSALQELRTALDELKVCPYVI